VKSTICTEAGRIVIEAKAGRVTSNGVPMLPHEAFLLGHELQRAAAQADVEATKARYVDPHDGAPLAVRELNMAELAGAGA
jgi:hypothetical protein